MTLSTPSLTYRKERGEERNKNREALAELNLRPADRPDWLRRLLPEDYTGGPDADQFNFPPPGEGPLWQFGLWINGQEVYIKVQLGATGSPPVCISFHPVRPGTTLRYPFKQ